MDTKVIKILHCARCGTDHEIEFRHFKGNPFEDADAIIYEWWGLCPVTGDPVLMTNKDPELVDPTPDEQLPNSDGG